MAVCYRVVNFKFKEFSLSYSELSESCTIADLTNNLERTVTEKGCLLFEARIVIPARLRTQVLQLVHHFEMQRMKQLARSVVYWPHTNDHIEHLCWTCTACNEHQNKPLKPANHPRMLPELAWTDAAMEAFTAAKDALAICLLPFSY